MSLNPSPFEPCFRHEFSRVSVDQLGISKEKCREKNSMKNVR